MFLMCDDIRTMLGFCFKLWRCVIPYWNPVLERLLRVVHYVYSKHIKPNGGMYHDGGNSVQWDLTRTNWKYFADGVIILHRLDMVLRRKVGFFDDLHLSSAIAKYKQQVLKKLEDRFRSTKDVLEANGFERETIECNILDLWKSLFDEEETSRVIRCRMLTDLFTPILGKPVHSEILALPVSTPYILDFAMQEVEEEVVRLRVELFLYVVESMFLLCDDIHTMLRFCYMLWRYAKRVVINENHVVDMLLCVMYYIYTRDIKPKSGEYQNDGNNSVQWELTQENFAYGFTDLNCLVYFLRTGGRCGRQITSIFEERVTKVEKQLGCVKNVSEANGFARDAMDAMEPSILDLWKSLFHKEAKEATPTLKAIKMELSVICFSL